MARFSRACPSGWLTPSRPEPPLSLSRPLTCRWLEIGEDVKSECSKYGAVRHAFVDKDSQGFVYVKFENVAGASAAKQALHARWFAGRMIAAEFQFTAVYNQHFPQQ